MTDHSVRYLQDWVGVVPYLATRWRVENYLQ